MCFPLVKLLKLRWSSRNNFVSTISLRDILKSTLEPEQAQKAQEEQPQA